MEKRIFKTSYLVNILSFQDIKGKKVKILINQVTNYHFKYITMFISILYASKYTILQSKIVSHYYSLREKG
jgi:F0F1-type ATP synthase delta subunit